MLELSLLSAHLRAICARKPSLVQYQLKPYYAQRYRLQNVRTSTANPVLETS